MSPRSESGVADSPPLGSVERRALLQALVAMTLAVPCGSLMAAAGLANAQGGDPKAARPQGGDQLVFASGEKVGKIISVEDLPLGGPFVIAYPMDPGSRIVRDGSRLNQILVLRLPPEDLDDATRARAGEGIVAYSAVCTHAACDVTLWQPETKMLRCPCHESEFDPKASGHVNGGPAPRRLPGLPVELVKGVVTASAGFSGRVGFQPGP
jgi:rieske iron-sulfur protein